eukprot:c39573_g1_i1 orf=102-497(+)
MFGRRKHTHVVTTTQPRTVAHRRSGGMGFMNRLRPRRTAPVAHHHHTHTAPVVATPAPRARRTFGRRKHAHGTHHSHVTTTTAAPVRPARRSSLGDKMNGAMLKLRGSLSGRPGMKAAGERQMHSTGRRYY